LRSEAFVTDDNNVMVPDMGHRAMWYVHTNLSEEPLRYCALMIEITHFSETSLSV